MHMYQRILQAPLNFPPGLMSPEAEDFIARLLIRDPKQRLGHGGAAGIQAIKRHPWFALFGLDFNFLYNKQIIPPFRPASDRPNIDEEFQQEPVADTPLTSSGLVGGKPRVKFPQFSYQADDNNAFANNRESF
jgi:hypothetical protein